MNNRPRKWADPLTARGQIERVIEPIISGGATDKQINQVVDQLLKERRILMNLIKQGEAVVGDFMPNIKVCVIQDFGRLNEFLLNARKVNPNEQT